MTIYQHIRHPRIASRRADRPVKVLDLLPRGTAINRFNTKVAIIITTAVGSMWCARRADLVKGRDLVRTMRRRGRARTPDHGDALGYVSRKLPYARIFRER
jgi:hypothetical protein